MRLLILVIVALLPIITSALIQIEPDAISELTCTSQSSDGSFYYGETIRCSIYCKNQYGAFAYVVADEQSFEKTSVSLDPIKPDTLELPGQRDGSFRNLSIGANGRIVTFDFVAPMAGSAGVLRVRAVSSLSASNYSSSVPEPSEIRGSPIMFRLKARPDLSSHDTTILNSSLFLRCLLSLVWVLPLRSGMHIVIFLPNVDRSKLD
jgi:hypothetical protein